MLSDIQAIVLAAGKSTRLYSNNSILREKICGKELILYPLETLHQLSIPIITVIGFQGTLVKKIIEQHYTAPEIQYSEQKELLGTAHAVQSTQSQWQSDHLLIMHANIPCITSTLIKDLYTQHSTTNAAVSFIATHPQDVHSDTYHYVSKKKGRVFIRRSSELSIKEQQDNCCIVAGIYLISRSFLTSYSATLSGEDDFAKIINRATDAGHTVSMLTAPFDHVRNITTYQDIWATEQIKRAELIRLWMSRGVRFSAAQNVHLDVDIHIGAGTFIGNGVHIVRGTSIGTQSTIGAFSILDHATIGNNVTVHPHSIIHQSTIGDHTHIGPFAHIQSDTIVGTHCALGNFVETKRTMLGNHSKAKHLTYLGDAQIGAYVNIGAGTITCNYNGKTKQVTHIKDHVFIGSNNSLVAPVTIEQEAFTAAGSVITENVPSHALAIARARQVNKEGYVQAREPESSQEENNDTKQSLSFIGAKKSNFDL